LGRRRGARSLCRRRERGGARARARTRGGPEGAVTGEAVAGPDFPEVAGYSILRVIGRGGQGTVYLARREDELGRELALKHFGPARALDGSATAGGTPAFAAPEVLLGDRHVDGVRADIYSAGATLHFLLTGRAPFPGRAELIDLERRGASRAIQQVLRCALKE